MVSGRSMRDSRKIPPASKARRSGAFHDEALGAQQGGHAAGADQMAHADDDHRDPWPGEPAPKDIGPALVAVRDQAAIEARRGLLERLDRKSVV